MYETTIIVIRCPVSIQLTLTPRVNCITDLLGDIPLHAKASLATVEELKTASEQQRPAKAVLRLTNFRERATVREMQRKESPLQKEFEWPDHLWYAADMWPALRGMSTSVARTVLFVSQENVLAIAPGDNGIWTFETLSKGQVFPSETFLVSLLPSSNKEHGLARATDTRRVG